MNSNFKDTNNREELRKYKNRTLQSLSTMLDKDINKDGSNYKRAALLSYWLNDFSKYYENESKFNPVSLLNYERGSIIKVHFGFNVGSEHGGLHYAVVIGKNNNLSNPVLNVIPLVSKKETKKVKDSEVDIGADLYNKISNKAKKIELELLHQLTLLENNKKAFDDAVNNFASLVSKSETSLQIRDIYNNLTDNASFIKKQIESTQLKINNLNRIKQEIKKLKAGSIACVNQITTISKMRIYDPKSSNGVLFNIKLSNDSMDKINDKIKELFVYNTI